MGMERQKLFETPKAVIGFSYLAISIAVTFVIGDAIHEFFYHDFVYNPTIGIAGMGLALVGCIGVNTGKILQRQEDRLSKLERKDD